MWRAWAVFLPGELRARNFGDVVARTGKTHVRLRRQIRHLGYKHRKIVPIVNMMALRTNWRERGFWFHLRHGQLAFFYLRRGQLAFFSFFFCICGTKREFFLHEGNSPVQPLVDLWMAVNAAGFVASALVGFGFVLGRIG